ncbi:hypothetical protein D3C81_1917460 [compost metagenome]
MLIPLHKGNVHGAVIQLRCGITGMIVNGGQLSGIVAQRFLHSVVLVVLQTVADFLLLPEQRCMQLSKLLWCQSAHRALCSFQVLMLTGSLHRFFL